MSVITSCIVLSCAAVKYAWPMRFAGTWKQYSAKAIPQLTRITIHKAELLNRRWPYHENVMKIFEIVSSMTGVKLFIIFNFVDYLCLLSIFIFTGFIYLRI
ncbi:MAG: hypothetical protein A2Y25_06300 [Candidatus Melainabacteria bacterium GWF2_37_15]|nr:MAG: hypothetical protein A2Y25_06300 [Candidatus Melainabacteria bacterium GWF2_37_15]